MNRTAANRLILPSRSLSSTYHSTVTVVALLAMEDGNIHSLYLEDLAVPEDMSTDFWPRDLLDIVASTGAALCPSGAKVS